MSGYRTRPKADEDVVEGAQWIRADILKRRGGFLMRRLQPLDGWRNIQNSDRWRDLKTADWQA